MKKYITIACLAFAGLSFAQPLEQEEKEFVRYERKATELVQQPTYEAALVSAFKAGNAAKIASYFAENVDLSILDTENSPILFPIAFHPLMPTNSDNSNSLS